MSGERVLVVGAAGRIGHACALAMADAGAHVVASDIDAAGLARTAALLGATHHTSTADLASADDIDRLVQHAVARLGGLSAVVTSAGALDRGGTIIESDIETLDRALAVNTRAPYLLVRAALPHLLANGRGSIVNIASIHGLIAAPGFAPYAVSKIGVVQLTRQVAVEYGKDGVRCNAICPGAVRSDGEPAADDLQDYRDAVGRIATPDEIAHIAVFLAGKRASFVNGAIIPADGGYTAR